MLRNVTCHVLYDFIIWDESRYIKQIRNCFSPVLYNTSTHISSLDMLVLKQSIECSKTFAPRLKMLEAFPLQNEFEGRQKSGG